MVKHPERVDDVKTLIWKAEVLSVADQELTPLIVDGESAADNFDASRSQVHAGDERPSSSKLKQVGTGSKANLEQSLVPEAIETDCLLHPGRIDVVAVVFDGLEVFSSAELEVPGGVRAARICPPLLSSPPFVVVGWDRIGRSPSFFCQSEHKHQLDFTGGVRTYPVLPTAACE